MTRSTAVAVGLAAALGPLGLAGQPAADSARSVPRRPVVATPAPPPAASDAWVASDKLRHFVLSGFTLGVSHAGLTAVGLRSRPALVGAATATAVVGIGKELVDRRRGGRASSRDLLWDAVGAALWGSLVARAGR